MTIELNGKVTTIGELSGIIDSDTTLGGAVAVGGTIITSGIAERGLKGERGDKGDRGGDGYSPRAYVEKTGSRATIKITDRLGTTTADVYDGNGGDVVTVHLYYDGDEYSADASLSYILDNIRNDKEVVLKFRDTIYPFLFSPDTDVCYFGLCWAKDNDTISAELIEFTPSIIARSIYEYDIFSGNYNDLSNKPTIHNVPSGGSVGQVLTKSSNVDYATTWAYRKGRVWFGSSSSAGNVSTKVVSTVDGDFVPSNGDVLLVFFNGKNTYSGGYINLTVDEAPTITTLSGYSSRAFYGGEWGDGAIVPFVYNNGYFYMVNSTPATTSSLGVTMLTNTISDNELLALTPKAVYDAGYLTSAHEVPSGGSAGQVLAKNTNTDYDLTWITPSGGGGGTTDYSELVNKPSINSVTLSGNLSASDLSLASASHSHTVSDISNFPSLASVATSGDYDDLIDKPAIHNVPSGGSSGQVLGKSSNDDYALSWITPSGSGEIAYCTCSDSAATVSKAATIVTGSLASLSTGAQVAVKFTYTNAATNPTLNVNSTGAKAIMRGGTAHVGTNTNESWGAGTVVYMLYDGSTWNIVGWLNTTYTGGTGAQIIAGSEALNKVWSPQQIHDGISGMLPTITDTYDSSSSDGMSGKAVKSAIDALDGSVTGTAGSGKTLTAFSQTDGKVSATFGNISITKSQVSDFPTLASVATSGDYDDLIDKPTIPTITDTYNGSSSDGMSGKAVKSAIGALDGSISGSAGASKTLTAFSQTDGVVSATFGNISISKSQISDFPTIPTVNDATLTIQKNGTNVQTFTANASSNATANIVVHDVPSGGTNGQVLAKNSNTDYDLKWVTGGGGGGTLVQIVRWT